MPNRIGSYVLLFIAFVALIVSAAFCALMAWGMIEGMLNGTILDNEPAEEWDIR